MQIFCVLSKTMRNKAVTIYLLFHKFVTSYLLRMQNNFFLQI